MNKKGQISPKVLIIGAGIGVLFFSLTSIEDTFLKIIGSLVGAGIIWKGTR